MLFNTLPAQADMKNPAHARSSVTELKSLPPKTKPFTQKKNSHQSQKKLKQPSSAFVTLSHFILDGKTTAWTTDYLFFAHDAADGDVRFTSEADGTRDAIVGQPLFPAAGKANRVLNRSVFPGLRNPLSLAINNLYDLDEGFGSGSNLFVTHSDSNDQQPTLSNDTGKSAGSPFAYSYKADSVSLNAGISWIRDIADSSGISKAFEQPGFENIPDQVSGLNLNLGASFRAFTLTGGYIRALNKAPAPLFLNESETEPSAWNGEIAYTTELLDKETVLAVGYLKSSESLNLYLPEQRYITKASMALFDSTILSLEYYLDKDFATGDGSTDEDGYGITTKIGFGF
jgi:hypothetical protein